jgi:CheY-like chemotaxis protein
MPNAKLLIVEDEEIVAFDIESTLKALGYAVPAIASSEKKRSRMLPKSSLI